MAITFCVVILNLISASESIQGQFPQLPAPQSSDILAGRIVDDGGQAFPGGLIQIVDLSNKMKRIKPVRASSHGYFVVKTVPFPGDYLVIASRKTNSQMHVGVSFVSNPTVVLVIVVSPARPGGRVMQDSAAFKNK